MFTGNPSTELPLAVRVIYVQSRAALTVLYRPKGQPITDFALPALCWPSVGEDPITVQSLAEAEVIIPLLELATGHHFVKDPSRASRGLWTWTREDYQDELNKALGKP